MTRRLLRLLIILALSCLMPLLAVEAQPQRDLPVVGVLEPGPPPTVVHARCLEAFHEGLRAFGYREGHTVVLEERYAAFQSDRLTALAAELVQRRPAVLWTHSNAAAWVLKGATTTIPVVVAVSQQLVEEGLVDSLTRPGGNLTGLESQSLEQTSKRLEVLKEALPRLTRVALLFDPASHRHGRIPSLFEGEARALRIELLPVEARDPEAFDAAFAAMAEQRAEALVVIDNAMFARHAPRLAELALTHRLPSIAAIRTHTQAGGLLAYGANIPDLCQRSAAYVDKILKGAKPADLPVERAMTFDLLINLKTAAQLGLTMPPTLLSQATEIIR
jgi:putative tryptophan/tyrosine transport system substrate-binding protein